MWSTYSFFKEGSSLKLPLFSAMLPPKLYINSRSLIKFLNKIA